MGKSVLVLSSNLSLEEMSRLQKVARTYDVKVSGYEENILDASFGDDFLKCANRSANARALKLLEIDTSKEFLDASLQGSELVIFVGRDDVELIGESQSAPSVVVLHATQKALENTELTLPIASHTQRDGSFINIDGLVQYSACKISINAAHRDLLSIIAAMLEDGIVSTKSVWDEELVARPCFSHLSFELLKTTPKVDL